MSLKIRKGVISLWIILLLASCSNPKDLEKIGELERKISQIETERKNDLFEKNKECWLLTDEIKKELFDPQYVYKNLDPQIEEIFYSKKRNSCLYVFSHQKLECEDMSIDEVWFEVYSEFQCIIQDKQLVDFFTKEMLAEKSTYNYNQTTECYDRLKNIDDNYFDTCDKAYSFNFKVKEFKN